MFRSLTPSLSIMNLHLEHNLTIKNLILGIATSHSITDTTRPEMVNAIGTVRQTCATKSSVIGQFF